VLNQLHHNEHIRFRAEPGLVIISTAEVGSRATQCRMYDVRDLLDDLERTAKPAASSYSDWDQQWRFRWQPARENLCDVSDDKLLMLYLLPAGDVSKGDALARVLECQS